MQMFRGKTVIHVGFEKDSGVQHYQPYEDLVALIQVRPEREINCRDVWVYVGWHTEGKGDRNSAAVYSESLGVLGISPDEPLTYELHYQLPNDPWSYEGELLRIVWTVHVKVEINLLPDINHHEPFVLRPPDSI